MVHWHGHSLEYFTGLLKGPSDHRLDVVVRQTQHRPQAVQQQIDARTRPVWLAPVDGGGQFVGEVRERFEALGICRRRAPQADHSIAHALANAFRNPP